MAAAQPRTQTRRFPFGELLMAVGVLGTGLFFFLGAMNITVLGTYARIGPRFFPYIVGGGLLLAGLLLLWQATVARRLRARRDSSAAAPARENWLAVTWIAVGLALNVLLMEPAGYVLSTTCLFFFAAFGLGSRRSIVSATAGLVLSLLTYFAFTQLLDLHLPPGLLIGIPD